MASYKDNVDRIEIVAAGLKDLGAEPIYVGGACVQFYVPNPAILDCRPTRDVDCVVKLSSYLEFSRLGEKLRALGFAHDTSEGAPIIRWIFNGIKVDIIPEEGRIAGFRDVPWFKKGRAFAVEKKLPSGLKIRILPLAFYMAAKLDASMDRGRQDYPVDHDLEDIICIIDANSNLSEILSAPDNVKQYIVESFSRLLGDDDFRRSISGHIGFDTTATARAKDVEAKMIEILGEHI